MATDKDTLSAGVTSIKTARQKDHTFMTPDERAAHVRMLNKEACRRRDARKRAAKSGLEGPALLTQKRPTDPVELRAYNANRERQRRADYPDLYKIYEDRRVRPEDHAQKCKDHYQANRERYIKDVLAWQSRNKEKCAVYRLVCYNNRKRREAEHPELKQACAKKRQDKHKKRYSSDVAYRMRIRLRSAFRQSLRLYGANRKTFSVTKLIGCSMKDFVIHIERQFKPGMTWANSGMNGWHVDHIIPCALFDLSRLEEQRACWHFTNLRPSWAADNLHKSDRRELLL